MNSKESIVEAVSVKSKRTETGQKQAANVIKQRENRLKIKKNTDEDKPEKWELNETSSKRDADKWGIKMKMMQKRWKNNKVWLFKGRRQ